MSSTTKGRDDWAREDDLDLGNDHNEDEQLPAAVVDNGVVFENGVDVDASAEELKDESIAQVEEDIPDLTGQSLIEGVVLFDLLLQLGNLSQFVLMNILI